MRRANRLPFCFVLPLKKYLQVDLRRGFIVAWFLLAVNLNLKVKKNAFSLPPFYPEKTMIFLASHPLQCYNDTVNDC